ncbi:MAG: SAM-dependent methyltransferase [Candidatus Binatia bacterium]|jgi:SAM-dependent methyltransferase
MTTEAPSSFNQHIFFEPKSVFYGTDDGYQDGSFTEVKLLKGFYDEVEPSRKENIHLVSAVGGLYGLNLIPLWKPSKITFFDINPHATEYFELIRRVFLLSSTKQDFLDRLSEGNYEAESDSEKLIRENLILKQRGELKRDRGSSYKRDLETSWKYALDHFDLTKSLLADESLEIRTEGIESESFGAFISGAENVWIFCSNIVEFVFSGLQFGHPSNAVMVSVVYPGQVELLDLAPFGDRPVEVHFKIPLEATPVGENLIPEDPPKNEPDETGIQLAKICREDLNLPASGRLLDIGCNWGRLAEALGDHLDNGGGLYDGIDPQRDNIIWAQHNLMPGHRSCSFHIANLRNKIYNPTGSLDPRTFRFPYDDGRFDVVVAHSLFPYMAPDEFEAYVSEISRILAPGGRLLASFYLLNSDSPTASSSADERACFRYPTGDVTTSGPNLGGLAAHQSSYVQSVFAKHGIKANAPIEGSWRGNGGGGLAEDVVLGVRD